MAVRRLSSHLTRLLHAASDVAGDDVASADGIRDLVGAMTAEDQDADALFAVGSNAPRLRPLLVVLSAKAAGAAHVDPELQYATEFLYLALVVQDLAIGQKGGRRRRVAKRIVRRSIGWLGARHLTLRAMELARHAPSPDVLHELVDVLRDISDSEVLAKQLQTGSLPTIQDWSDHADGHTGAVFSFCCRAGGAVAEGDPREISALSRYGRHLGRMWHIAEDVFSIREIGPEHLVARARSGRPVLPVIQASSGSPAVREAVGRFRERPTVEGGREVWGRVVAHGGVGRAREVMLDESWRSRLALRQLPKSVYRRALDNLSVGMVRTFYED